MGEDRAQTYSGPVWPHRFISIAVTRTLQGPGFRTKKDDQIVIKQPTAVVMVAIFEWVASHLVFSFYLKTVYSGTVPAHYYPPHLASLPCCQRSKFTPILQMNKLRHKEIKFFLCCNTFNWSIVDIQCCVHFCCIVERFRYLHVYRQVNA